MNCCLYAICQSSSSFQSFQVNNLWDIWKEGHELDEQQMHVFISHIVMSVNYEKSTYT